MRKIVSENSQKCSLSAELVKQSYQKPALSDRQRAFGELPKPSSASREAGELIVEPISTEEVQARLERVDKSSAPGPSGVSYRYLLHSRSDVLLAGVFNSVLRIGKLPRQWQTLRLVMIHKNGDLGLPTSWRPIAL